MVHSLNRTLFVVVDKLSSSQLLDFIRSEGKGNLLHYLLVLRCSVCMLRSPSMSNMPYCSMHMPIGWNGLSMPTEGCSVHMPIVTTNFKVRGVTQDSVLYMMKIILTHIPIECGLLTLMYIDSIIVLARPWPSIPIMVKLSGLVLCPDWLPCP